MGADSSPVSLYLHRNMNMGFRNCSDWKKVGAAFCLAAGALLFLFLMTYTPVPSIDKNSFDRIQIGMNEEEVDAVLAGPARDYTTKTMIEAPEHGLVLKRASFTKKWRGNGGVVTIGFDDDHLVKWKRFNAVSPLEPSWIEELRSWTGL
jgi:hypothetical protein